MKIHLNNCGFRGNRLVYLAPQSGPSGAAESFQEKNRSNLGNIEKLMEQTGQERAEILKEANASLESIQPQYQKYLETQNQVLDQFKKTNQSSSATFEVFGQKITVVAEKGYGPDLSSLTYLNFVDLNNRGQEIENFLEWAKSQAGNSFKEK